LRYQRICGESRAKFLRSCGSWRTQISRRAGEIQPLKEGQRILRVSGEAAAVVEQDDIERARGRQGCIHHAAQPRTVRSHAAQRFIGIDVFFQESEAVGMRVFAAYPKLVLDRTRTLEVTGVAGVSGTAKGHGFPLS
jgi:hypothetical protein